MRRGARVGWLQRAISMLSFFGDSTNWLITFCCAAACVHDDMDAELDWTDKQTDGQTDISNIKSLFPFCVFSTTEASYNYCELLNRLVFEREIILHSIKCCKVSELSALGSQSSLIIEQLLIVSFRRTLFIGQQQNRKLFNTFGEKIRGNVPFLMNQLCWGKGINYSPKYCVLQLPELLSGLVIRRQ